MENGPTKLFMSEDGRLMYQNGSFEADVEGVAGMFSSSRWSKSDIIGQRFYEASQASGVPIEDIQKALDTKGEFVYTPKETGR